MRKKKNLITVICKSCLTGKVVWIYRGPSRGAARVAYWRACKAEIERVRNWGETVARRRESIANTLKAILGGLPKNTELTPQQAEAARQLEAIGNSDVPCYREFYDHIMEERRRRAEDQEIRRKMRLRENKQNDDYDK